MASKWCLLKKYVDLFKQGLKSGEITPEKLSNMTSQERHDFLAKYVGETNATNVNGLFESKLLLKNQKMGYINWARRVSGISKTTRQDIVTKIERLDTLLSKSEEKVFLEDLVSLKLGVNISETEAKTIFEMSKKNAELKGKIPSDSPIRSKERLEYGVANALLKDYVAKLKSDAKTLSFKEQPARFVLDKMINAIPNASQAIRTAYDNSVWLRQMIGALTTPRYTKIWTRNFLKSFKDIGIDLKGGDASLLARADVYSRPNAINGKYDVDTNGYGLGVRSEDVYQSSFPAKIPGLRRLFLASQDAFNNGALRMRADIADMEIKAAETLGIDTMNKENASAIGSLVTSITGRGSVGGAEKYLRKIFWAPRMYAAQLNQITAHMFDKKATSYTKKLATKNLVKRLAVYTMLFTLAKLLDPDSVDEKEKLGKIKIWGKWIDVTGGQAAYLRLVMKMSNKIMGYMQGEKPKYGESTAMDDIESFLEGKLAPTLGLIANVLRGSFYGGEQISTKGMVEEAFTPISLQTWQDLSKDPSTANLLGLMIFESLGANVESFALPNSKTEIIPTDTKIKEGDFMSMVEVYTKAFDVDAETAFSKIFSGQKIVQVSADQIIVVARQPVGDSEKYKKDFVKKYGGNTKEVKLDHTIPNKLGGDEKPSNWKVVPNSVWSSYTKTENALIKGVKEKKITLKEAQKEIVKFKSIEDTAKRKAYGEKLQKSLQ